MAFRSRVLAGVLIRRRVTAANEPAGAADPQMDPLVTGLQAFLASDDLLGSLDTNLVQMRTGSHVLLLALSDSYSGAFLDLARSAALREGLAAAGPDESGASP